MHDIYTRITERIVAQLEAGVAPWVRPWHSEADPVPINAITRRPYRGINVLALGLETAARGFDRNRWMTYRQAAEAGGQVRRGARGCQIVFYQRPAPAPDEVAEEASDKHKRLIPLLRVFTVFNVAEVDGLPPDIVPPQAPFHAWQAEDAADLVLAESRAEIRHGGNRAYYAAGDDYIQLPNRSAFATGASYYATALHELVHWSGHSSRCDRKLDRFGEEAYAAEELIAELGAAFLCAHCRIDGQLQHASYIGSWLKVLKSDKRAVFVAATKAQQACDFLLGTSPATGAIALAA